MKRSEILELAIEDARKINNRAITEAFSREVVDREFAKRSLTLSVLLAEQKREAGCDKCNDPRILEIQIETGFDFCPHCGRRLTDGESE